MKMMKKLDKLEDGHNDMLNKQNKMEDKLNKMEDKLNKMEEELEKERAKNKREAFTEDAKVPVEIKSLI